MRNLTATLYLTIVVLLGSVGVSWSGDFPSSHSSYRCACGNNGDVVCGGERNSAT